MIEITTESHFNVTTKETVNDVYLRLYLSAFKGQLVAELKPTNFTVLLTICSYMNENGECFPTQRQIAERCGISKTTVNKAINELLEFQVNDKAILERQLVETSNGKNSIYTVNPISQVAIFGGGIETGVSTNVSTNVATSNAFSTAKQVGDWYKEVYQNVYNVAPNINYARDYSIVKNKWLGKFTDDQICKMVEVGVREYDKRWKNPKFPRPSLSALVSWIGEQALGLSEDKDKEFKENEEITSNGDEMNNVAISRLASRLKK